MGFFSWLTSDTNESISNTSSARGARTVYLLQPGGEAPIEEPAYEGYGCFGGTNAYDWLARRNLPADKLAILTNDEIFEAGVTLAHGGYLEDPHTGAKLAIFHRAPAIIDPSIVFHAISYAEAVPGYDGRSANDLTAAGHLIRHGFDVTYPLKFSFSRDARYENLPAAQRCPQQGIYYDETD